MKTNLASKTLFIAATMLSSPAWADTNWAGWSVLVGVNQIAPKVSSGDLSAPALPGTKVDVNSNTQPIVSVNYAYNDHLAAEVVIGMPYKHNLMGAGSIAGTGTIGTVEALPPTAFVKYRFLEPKAMFRPYVGLGLTYAYFQKATGSAELTALSNTGNTTPTTFSVDTAWGMSPQIGVMYAINDKWFADFNVTKTYLKTTAHFSTGQSIAITLDPISTALGVGYHF